MSWSIMKTDINLREWLPERWIEGIHQSVDTKYTEKGTV